MKNQSSIFNISFGELDAMLKNIMRQTGVSEPEEVVRMVNSGEVKISIEKPKWTEKNGVIRFSVISDGTTGKQWISRLERKGFDLCDSSKKILRSKSFQPTSGEITQIAVLKSEIFNWSTPTSENIYKEAKERKFSLPNSEVACLIREKFSNKELEDMGLSAITPMHNPIDCKDEYGNNRQEWLSVNRSGGNSNLWGVSMFNGYFVGDRNYVLGFAFVESTVYGS